MHKLHYKCHCRIFLYSYILKLRWKCHSSSCELFFDVKKSLRLYVVNREHVGSKWITRNETELILLRINYQFNRNFSLNPHIQFSIQWERFLIKTQKFQVKPTHTTQKVLNWMRNPCKSWMLNGMENWIEWKGYEWEKEWGKSKIASLLSWVNY